MSIMRNHKNVLIVALSVWLFHSGSNAQQPQLGGQTPDTATGLIVERILAKVNGDIITLTDLENRQVNVLRQQGYVPSTETELARALADVTPGVIWSAVDELLLVQRGRMLGYYLSDEQFEQLVGNIKSDNNFDDDEQFETALLESEGMTVSDLRRVLERQVLVNQVQQIEILRKVVLTETEAREYYDANLDEYTENATVTLREILIAAPETTAGFNVVANEQARQEAETARQRVLDGDVFDAVAISLSDSPSKANGGLIGPIDFDILSQEVQGALEELEIGEISQPIRTRAGYQVLLLVERIEPLPLPFDEVKEGIIENVFNDRRIREFDRYLDELRGDAIIEWKDEELGRAYELYAAEQAVESDSQD